MTTEAPTLVYVAAHWEFVRRGQAGATYCKDRHCTRFPDVWSAVRITLVNARAAGFGPCRKCWKEQGD